MKSMLAAAGLLLSCASAHAQGVNGFQSLFPVAAFGDGRVTTNLFLDGTQVSASGYILSTRPSVNQGFLYFEAAPSNQSAISLDQFASAKQLQAVGAQQDQLAARQEQFAFFMRRDFDRLAQGIALASALTVMSPNPGERFALTVSGAGFDGRGAGAISGTYRVREDILVFGGYARSETQQLVKGGATFSFR